MADPMSYLQDPNLVAAREEAAASGQLAGQYESAAAGLPQQLEKAVQEKLDYNKDIIEEKNKAFATYSASAPTAREKYADIWDPFTREKLVAQERANAYLPYQNLSDILKQRTGTIQDIIARAIQGYTTMVTALQNAAQLKRQRYLDLYDVAKDMANIELSKTKTAAATPSLEDLVAIIERFRNVGNSSGQGPQPIPSTTVSSKGSTPGLVYEGGPDTTVQIGKPRLYDPITNATYEYDDYNDPDYLEDLQKGYQKI